MYEIATKHLTSQTLKKIVISAEKEFPFDFVCQFVEVKPLLNKQYVLQNVKNCIDGVHSIEFLCNQPDFYAKINHIFAGMERIPIASYVSFASFFL